MRRRLGVNFFLASREVGSLSAGTVKRRASDSSLALVYCVRQSKQEIKRERTGLPHAVFSAHL